ncbi:MAG: NAD(P)/FAD-dependent oxidoreductase, partial [Bdellovibrionales bacterium]
QIPEDKRWADVSNKELQTLAETLFATSFAVLGKNRYKDEFVECGGVDLKEIQFKRMESKICPGLFFAGEVLDIDGITGGFNFQNAWTGAWIASHSL